ncbi:hypothetical protein WJX77_011335 [Trebouxia sp. C0004]
MTTAHRPTWAPAKGGTNDEQAGSRVFAPSTFFRAKDQVAHTKLKFRQLGQNAADDLNKKDLRAELEDKERKHFRTKGGSDFEEQRQADLKLLEAPDIGTGVGGKPKVLVPKAVDADEEGDDDDDEESESSDDEDEEKELLLELARIRKEREQEAAKKAAEDEKSKQLALQEEVMHGNPLHARAQPDFQVKRRWDDDVVFKNQARGEPKVQKRFINDTIRSDFHRRFLTRYIK